MPKRKKTSRQNAYIGKAGQLAVMAELSLLGYNVSLPEIDKGDDIFVVNDHTGQLWRLQVKGATAQKNGGYQVIVDENQIQKNPNMDSPDLYFVFALRRDEEKRWRFVVMERKILKKYIEDRSSSGQHSGKFGRLFEDKGRWRRTISITFRKSKRDFGKVSCSYSFWDEHMEDWSNWPYLDHEAIAAELNSKKHEDSSQPTPSPLLLVSAG